MRLLLASRSAAYLALIRAIASNRQENKRLFPFHDRFAKHFLPASLKFIARLSALPFLNQLISGILDERWNGALTSCLACTRLIDVMTIQTIHDLGINQLILLGASYDCRIHRLDFTSKLHFVEVDHPTLQEEKRVVLENLKDKPAQLVDYISVDFGNEELETTIPHYLLKPHYRSLIIWEGITNALTIPIADKIFRYLSKFTSGTRIIFTYIDENILSHTQSFLGNVISPPHLRLQQEFWNFGLDPSRVKQFLAGYNMELIHDIDADTYRHTCYGDRADKMKDAEYYRVVMAVVK